MPDLEHTVILLGVLQGAAMSVVLAVRRTDRLANRFLGGLVGAVALMLLLGYVTDRWGFQGYPHLIALGNPLPFLFGPLLYLYITALTRPLARFESRFLLHGLLFVAQVIYMLQVFYLKAGDEKLALAREYLAGGGAASFEIMGSLGVAQALGYVLASFLALRRYGRKIEGYFSDLTRIDLRWLMAMVLANAVVWSTVLASRGLHTLGTGGSVYEGLERATQIGSALVVFLTGYVSLWQPELFQKARAAQLAEDEPPKEVASADEPPVVAAVTEAEPEATPGAPSLAAEPAPEPQPRYQRNRLDDLEAEQLAQKLRALMEKDEAYRDASLTLPALADALGATPHLVSQVLNVRIGRSFYVFVNSYRAEALKIALSDPTRHGRGVLELALEAGFNSKSTVNSFFKKHTGLTPTEFRRQAQSRHTRAEPA